MGLRRGYQNTLQGGDTTTLYRWAGALEARTRALPGPRDVTSDLQLGSPQLVINVNRQKAAALEKPTADQNRADARRRRATTAA